MTNLADALAASREERGSGAKGRGAGICAQTGRDPRPSGESRLDDHHVLVALGVTFPITERVKFSVALDVPFAFLHHRTLGLVALTGVSFRF